MLSITLIAIMSLASTAYVSCGDDVSQGTQESNVTASDIAATSSVAGHGPHPACNTAYRLIFENTPESFEKIKNIQNATPGFDLRDCRCNQAESTLLHSASIHGNQPAVSFFVDTLNMDVNAQDKIWKETPLHRAAYSGRSEIIEFLLKRGANPFLRNKNGDSPRRLALHNAEEPLRRGRVNECNQYVRTLQLLHDAELQNPRIFQKN